MQIIYHERAGRGWNQITYMVELAEELLAANVLRLRNHKSPSLLQKLSTFGSRQAGTETCLLVCTSPAELATLICAPNWKKRYRRIVAWIIDSFWIERLPRFIRYSRPFDQLFVTREEDIPEWTHAMRIPTTWLPWGTDVLRLGSGQPTRTWDLLRVGRQPPDWDDDSLTERDCLAKGLRFHGRPGWHENAADIQKHLMGLYGQSRFVLAFSNSANPMSYTHPTKEYITGRWLDAIACGATVAGIAPKIPSVERMLWPGATLDLGSVSRDEGMRILGDAVQSWCPKQAEVNYRRSLEQFDWRWRFAVIAEALDEVPEPLEGELRLLRERSHEECRPIGLGSPQ